MGEVDNLITQCACANSNLFLLSSAARAASQRLRGEVDNLITQCANEMWSHWSNTNMAFQQRITEESPCLIL
jgi:hypothetical protein